MIVISSQKLKTLESQGRNNRHGILNSCTSDAPSVEQSMKGERVLGDTKSESCKSKVPTP